MDEIPWEAIAVGIVGVVIFVPALNKGLEWAIRNDHGGPFSGIILLVGVAAAVGLTLLGGSLIVVIKWIFD